MVAKPQYLTLRSAVKKAYPQQPHGWQDNTASYLWKTCKKGKDVNKFAGTMADLEVAQAENRKRRASFFKHNDRPKKKKKIEKNPKITLEEKSETRNVEVECENAKAGVESKPNEIECESTKAGIEAEPEKNVLEDTKAEAKEQKLTSDEGKSTYFIVIWNSLCLMLSDITKANR